MAFIDGPKLITQHNDIYQRPKIDTHNSLSLSLSLMYKLSSIAGLAEFPACRSHQNHLLSISYVFNSQHLPIMFGHCLAVTSFPSSVSGKLQRFFRSHAIINRDSSGFYILSSLIISTLDYLGNNDRPCSYRFRRRS